MENCEDIASPIDNVLSTKTVHYEIKNPVTLESSLASLTITAEKSDFSQKNSGVFFTVF